MLGSACMELIGWHYLGELYTGDFMCPSFPFFFVLIGLRDFIFFICSYSGGQTVDALVEFVTMKQVRSI
jgi:hypothetical protein